MVGVEPVRVRVWPSTSYPVTANWTVVASIAPPVLLIVTLPAVPSKMARPGVHGPLVSPAASVQLFAPSTHVPAPPTTVLVDEVVVPFQKDRAPEPAPVIRLTWPATEVCSEKLLAENPLGTVPMLMPLEPNEPV